jgi:hypothetical protein
MKHKTQMIAVLIAVALGSPASADVVTTKPATRIDFNKMIDESNLQKSALHKDVKNQAAQAKAATERTDDKDKVIDFIDVEVGIGQTPALVDRRYDSVGDARVVPIN